MKNKTQTEIKRAGALWFACADAVKNNEKVPLSVFLLDLSDLTEQDIVDAKNIIKNQLSD